MLRTTKILLLTAALLFASMISAHAALQAVGPVSLQNGFPMWYEDTAGFQVAPCLGAGCLNAPADPPVSGNDLSALIGFGAEAFYWAASAIAPGCNADVVLTMQLGWVAAGDPVIGTQTPFTRIRVRADPTVAGTHTITTPFNSFTVDSAAGTRGINETIDVFGNPPLFSDLLAPTTFTHFFRAAVGVPTPGTVFNGTGPIAAPLPANTVFSIAGPGCNTSIDQFTVGGMAFDNGPNLAPIAKPMMTATQVATPVTLNLTANAVDPISASNVHGVNPRAVGLGAAAPFVFEPGVIGNPATPGFATANGRVVKNTDGTVTYLPAPAFSGVDSFPFVVQDTGGCISGQSDCSTAALGIPAPPAVPPAAQPPVPVLTIVTVEQLTSRASFRPKLQKWNIGGSTSIVNLTTTDGSGNPVLFTNLSGAQEVPAKISTGLGDVSLTLRNDATLGQVIDFSLNYSGLTGVTAAHIHTAAIGENAAFNMFLCTNSATPPAGIPVCPATGGTVTGTRSAADFVAGGGAATFPDLIAAIQNGGTYVNIHTAAFTGGELRGQVGRNVVAVHSGSTTSAPVLGVVAVPPLAAGQQISTWALPQKLKGVPAADRTLTIQTSAGNSSTIGLKIH